ncbi:MAG TPA: hypothetical protein VJG83_00655 [archaeon]|nr:hypothetical protein [archaeon]
MAGPLENFVFSILNLLKGSLSIVLPIFILAFIGKWLNAKIRKATKWSFIVTALLSTFALLWVLILIAYFYPILTSLQESGIGQVPSVFAPTLGELATSYAYGLFKVTISSLVISLILLPFEFIGLFVFESLHSRFKKMPEPIILLAACYLMSVVGAAIFLFLIPEAVSGIIYFIYFG